MTDIFIRDIFRHPVKGLSPDAMRETRLSVGNGLEGDRRFALALRSTRYDPNNPVHIRKTGFAMLMKHERLAKLAVSYDGETRTLVIALDGGEVARGIISDPVGRARLEDFFSVFLKNDLADGVRIVEGKNGHMFSDHKDRLVSIINLNTITDLEKATRTPVDPMRFRGNFYIEGPKPWAELSWEGRVLHIGDAALKVVSRIKRCGAVNVDPNTGVRDMNIPRTLMKVWGHIDFGVYAEILKPDPIKAGDAVTLD